MGSEDLFFKRKQDRESLGRKSKKREPHETALIICEGETEVYYLEGLRNELKLNKANVLIKLCMRGTNRATDPMNIVNEAEKYIEGKEYDKVYCVFDKEQSTYQDALKKIKEKQNHDLSLYAINSVPCFDYWLLLHFNDSAKPYKQKGKKSPGEQVKSELRRYIKDYYPGDRDIFHKTKEYLTIAIRRAKTIDKIQQKAKTDNPSTKVYELVEYLRSLKR
ncbi:MAG: RloB protein [Gammaproteobacteria bacterium]|nr:RloB protein [Gammaproteobacteria bacterium]